MKGGYEAVEGAIPAGGAGGATATAAGEPGAEESGLEAPPTDHGHNGRMEAAERGKGQVGRGKWQGGRGKGQVGGGDAVGAGVHAVPFAVQTRGAVGAGAAGQSFGEWFAHGFSNVTVPPVQQP